MKRISYSLIMKLKVRLYLFLLALITLCLLIKHIYFNDNKENPLRNNYFLEVLRADKNILLMIQKNVTLLVRYTSSMDFSMTINSFFMLYPNINIVAVGDTMLNGKVLAEISNPSQLKVIHMNLDLLNLIVDRNPLNYVNTKYLFVVPLEVLVIPPEDIKKLIKHSEDKNTPFIAVPVTYGEVKCYKLDLNLREWTLEFAQSEENDVCDFVSGDHGLFMKTENLRKIGEPFMLPFPDALYIQIKARDMKVTLAKDLKLKNLKERTIMKHDHERINMYHKLGIKKVIRENGQINWYGCTRETSRCFPTIVDSTPNYLFQGRWTPPCCLEVLRKTAKHVFKIFETYNVTYWLEGGSLLGAMRSKDIIPWDYDIDVGIYLKDINKSPWLQKVHETKLQGKEVSVVDKYGFVWEPSQKEEGDFYRVKASVTNTLHVDIFPFYPKNGVMTKNTWMPDHSQDKEFPEHYLKPLTTIEFVGVEASAPNNIREFLELKFGKGCVENPKYPNEKLLAFPKVENETPLDNEHYDS